MSSITYLFVLYAFRDGALTSLLRRCWPSTCWTGVVHLLTLFGDGFIATCLAVAGKVGAAVGSSRRRLLVAGSVGSPERVSMAVSVTFRALAHSVARRMFVSSSVRRRLFVVVLLRAKRYPLLLLKVAS